MMQLVRGSAVDGAFRAVLRGAVASAARGSCGAPENIHTRDLDSTEDLDREGKEAHPV